MIRLYNVPGNCTGVVKKNRYSFYLIVLLILAEVICATSMQPAQKLHKSGKKNNLLFQILAEVICGALVQRSQKLHCSGQKYYPSVFLLYNVIPNFR